MADTSISTFSDDEQDTAPQEPDPDYESELLEVCSGLGATKENEEGEERFDRGDREECLSPSLDHGRDLVLTEPQSIIFGKLKN